MFMFRAIHSQSAASAHRVAAFLSLKMAHKEPTIPVTTASGCGYSTTFRILPTLAMPLQPTTAGATFFRYYILRVLSSASKPKSTHGPWAHSGRESTNSSRTNGALVGTPSASTCWRRITSRMARCRATAPVAPVAPGASATCSSTPCLTWRLTQERRTT